MPAITPNPPDAPTPTSQSPREVPPTSPNNPHPDPQDSGPRTQDVPFLSLLRHHRFDFFAATASLSDADLKQLASNTDLLAQVNALAALAQSCLTLHAIAARTTALHTLTPLAQSTDPQPEQRRAAEALTRASNLRSLPTATPRPGRHQSAAPNASSSPSSSSRRDWCNGATASSTANTTAKPELPIPPPAATPHPDLTPLNVCSDIFQAVTNPDNPALTASTLAAFSTPSTTINAKPLFTDHHNPARGILDANHEPLRLMAAADRAWTLSGLDITHPTPDNPARTASLTTALGLPTGPTYNLTTTLTNSPDTDPPHAWRLASLTLKPAPRNTS